MDRADYVNAARTRAHALYLGEVTPHRSCGIALAETFGLPSRPYQALRKGGLTGDGSCGAIQAGILVLGELLGDPSPTGGATPDLRTAIHAYRTAIGVKLPGTVETSCNVRTAPAGDFSGRPRLLLCTALAAVVAETVAEVLWDLGRETTIPPADWDRPAAH